MPAPPRVDITKEKDSFDLILPKYLEERVCYARLLVGGN